MQLQLILTFKFISDDKCRLSCRPRDVVFVVIVADGASSALTFDSTFTCGLVGRAVSYIYLWPIYSICRDEVHIFYFALTFFFLPFLIIMDMKCTCQCIKTFADFVRACECATGHCRCLTISTTNITNTQYYFIFIIHINL